MANEVRMAPRKLTDAAVDKFKPEPGARTIFPDTEAKGLELRVAPSGDRSFALLYRVKGDPKKRRVTLGDYPGVGLGAARHLATSYRNEARAGRDPAADRKRLAAENAERQQNTVGAVAEEFIKRHVSKLRSADINEGVIRRELLGQVREGDEWVDDRRNPRWRGIPITDIARRDVVALVERIIDEGHPYLARLVLAYARKLFRWAIGRDVYGLQANPCSDVSAKEHGAPAVARQVALGPDHLRLVWRAAGSLAEPFGPFVKMLLLSGQRRNEMARLAWSEIDFGAGVIVIPAERMKAKRPHEVPLSPAMVALLEGITRGKGAFVFSTTEGASPISGFAKIKTKLDKAVAELQTPERQHMAKLPKWRLHDMRRTVRTGLGSIPSIPHDIRELVIDRKSVV